MIMNYGVDTTRPVELRPNGPDKRTRWAVPMQDGFLHTITASVYRYDTEHESAGTLYVHIGCGVLLTDRVQDGESEWDAIIRVVTTWQRNVRNADHAEALVMDAELSAPAEVTGRLADGDAEYIGYKPHPRHVTPGTMGRQMIAWSGRVREVAKRRGMSRQDVLSALPAHLFAR